MDVLMIKDGVVVSVSSIESIEYLQPYYPDMTLIERDGDAWIGWLYVGGTFVPPASAVNYSNTCITQYAFLSRFTDNEAVAIDLASQGATTQAAMMRRIQKKIDAARYIDLSDVATRTGVLLLETYGLLASGRASEILDTPVRAKERYVVGA